MTDAGRSTDPPAGISEEERASDGSRSRAVLLITVSVAVVLAGLIALFAWAPNEDNVLGSSPLVGQPAPDLAGVALNGSSFDLADHRGEWVVVNFFATWCVPCVREHPELVAFDEAHRTLGDASVVSVVFDDDPAEVRAFFETNGGDWPVLEDTGGIAVDYGVSGVPESFVVGPEGFVEARLISGVTREGLEAVIARVASGRGLPALGS